MVLSEMGFVWIILKLVCVLVSVCACVCVRVGRWVRLFA